MEPTERGPATARRDPIPGRPPAWTVGEPTCADPATVFVLAPTPQRVVRWLATLALLVAWAVMPSPGLADPSPRSDDPAIDRWMTPSGEAGFLAVWPAAGRISAHFGEISSVSPRGHSGIDIAGDYGDPVSAAAAGQVVQAGWSPLGYGNLIVIEHAGGMETWYGHLSVMLVSRGQSVQTGEQIGRIGSTGFSTGPHLHFEVRQDGQLRNPILYLS